MHEAIHLNSDFIDLELSSPRRYLYNLLEKKKKTQIILSFHEFRHTPSIIELKRTLDRMLQFEADILKIVTYARTIEDNLHTLLLILHGKQRRKRILAFCMGEKGKISRLISPLLGAPWTYASLTGHKKSASGQLTVKQMREVFKSLEC